MEDGMDITNYCFAATVIIYTIICFLAGFIYGEKSSKKNEEKGPESGTGTTIPPRGGTGQSNICMDEQVVYHYAKTPGGALTYQSLCGKSCNNPNHIITKHYLSGMANEINCPDCLNLMNLNKNEE